MVMAVERAGKRKGARRSVAVHRKSEGRRAKERWKQGQIKMAVKHMNSSSRII